MQSSPTRTTMSVREAVGIFHDWAHLQAAVDELMAHGFDRSEISLLAGEKTVEQKLGHVYEKVKDLEDDANAPRVAFVGRDSLTEAKAFTVTGLGYLGAVAATGAIVASGGSMALLIGGAAALGGGGMLLGSWLAKAIGRDRAASIEAQLNKGGLLLWVRTKDPEHEQRALDILARHQAADAHVHDVVTEVDPAADPLTGLQPDPFLPGART
jgi:hypothetical protein